MNASYLISDQAAFDRLLHHLAGFKISQKIELVIRPYKFSRSTAQNRLYWKWCGFMASETGHDKDDMHEFFKRKFLGDDTKVLFGEETTISKSSSKLNVQEFADYLTRIEAFCAGQGYLLPRTADYDASMR